MVQYPQPTNLFGLYFCYIGVLVPVTESAVGTWAQALFNIRNSAACGSLLIVARKPQLSPANV